MRVSKTFLGMSSFVIFIASSLLCGLGYSGYFKTYDGLAFSTGFLLCILSFILFLITLVRLFADKN